MQETISKIFISDPIASISRSSQPCKICGAPTLHLNYGVLTCDSCKIFFRRHVIRNQTSFQCHFSGNCTVNISNRHRCPSCRLAKCFASGMQSDLIRGPRSNKNLFKKYKSQQLSTLNLLQSDKSTLDSRQWALLSNLVNNYDERALVSIAQQFINESDNSHALTTIDFTLPKQFFRKIYETSEEYLRSNEDLCTLSEDDRSIFLRNASDNVTCLGATFTWSWSQLYNHQSFLQVFEKFYGAGPLIMIRCILKFIDPDITVAKLALSLFVFSNNLSIFTSPMTIKPFNTLAIFHIQNIYAEMTWKYLVYKYGYYQSIQRFNKLIQCLLAATNMVSDAQNIEQHMYDITSLIEQTELSLVLDDIERIE